MGLKLKRQGFVGSEGTAPSEDRHAGRRVVRDTTRLRKAAAGSGCPITRYAAGAPPRPVGGERGLWFQLFDDDLPVHPRGRRADIIVGAGIREGDGLRLALLPSARIPIPY